MQSTYVWYTFLHYLISRKISLVVKTLQNMYINVLMYLFSCMILGTTGRKSTISHTTTKKFSALQTISHSDPITIICSSLHGSPIIVFMLRYIWCSTTYNNITKCCFIISWTCHLSCYFVMSLVSLARRWKMAFSRNGQSKNLTLHSYDSKW